MLGTPGLYAQLACIWEATARKAGNVHRLQDFDNLTYMDFLNSAASIAPVFETAQNQRVGATVLQAIQATRQVCSTNTNLGMVLLFAPLAAVPAVAPLTKGLEGMLNNLNLQDAQDVFGAIRLAQPGGIGKVSEQDVSQPPTANLFEAMRLAADRDLVARQYVTCFATVLQEGLPELQEGLARTGELETAIVLCHLHLLARHGDSLIARKVGSDLAHQAQIQAQSVLSANFPLTEQGRAGFRDFDAWLRADGHKRNPGASADLTAACLFVALREGIIQLPLQYSWTGGF
ncbi:MAG TPA: triphosphoribosyl-dephospho-CoA synthase [Gemmataceae bacterium]|nr:triphosphoribosyl-dephospho-CoA synthase [Gemmataceae bacterium]